jgi:hypothetical protein
MNVSGPTPKNFTSFSPRNMDPLRDILFKLTIGLFVILLIILLPAFIITVFSYYWNSWFSSPPVKRTKKKGLREAKRSYLMIELIDLT